MSKLKILIVDDHQVVRNGVRSLIEDEDDIEILGDFSNGLDTIDFLRTTLSDIVLLDISMPKMSGIETAEIITKKFPSVKSIIFSMHNNKEYIIKSVECGARGYLLKDISKEELLSAIRRVHDGEKYFSSQVSNTLIEAIVNKPVIERQTENLDLLSKQQKVILKYIVDGKNSREIAEELGLSVRTVDNHRYAIMKKADVKNTAELVKFAFKSSLI